MLCQGMSGRTVADNWRKTNPGQGISLNFPNPAQLAFARSMFTLDAYRSRVFPEWGLDWHKIAASPVDATFNVYNFSKHELEVLPPSTMTEDLLCACVSLPMWFPPVEIGGNTYIDSVYVTDANHGYADVDLPIGKQFAPPRPVTIGPGSWLGHGTVVLPGSSIGEHVVVGAGSVVTGALPAFSVAVGNPARVIRQFDNGTWARAQRGAAGDWAAGEAAAGDG